MKRRRHPLPLTHAYEIDPGIRLAFHGYLIDQIALALDLPLGLVHEIARGANHWSAPTVPA